MLSPDRRVILRQRDQYRREGGVFTIYLVEYRGLGVGYDEWKLDRDIPVQMKKEFHGIPDPVQERGPY